MEQLLGIVGFEDRGNFVLGEQYEYLNIVSTTDGCYFAKKDNRNVPLTDEDTWKQFSRLGVDGKNIELGINSTHLQWRLEGDTNWTDLIALSSLKGADGKELEIRTDNGYIQTKLTGENWSDLIELESLKGPKGDRGLQGKPLELNINSTHLQWRLEGDTNWTDLVTLSSLKGEDGKELEVRTQDGYIQTRLTGEGWSDLIDLEILKGPKGDRGLQGKPLIVLSNGHYGFWNEDLQDYVDSGVEASTSIDVENVDVNFTESAIRENIQTGEKIPAIFGKLKKWFNDLGVLAWKNKVDYATDIDNLPVIPETQIQSNWDQTDTSKSDFIHNKPVIPAKISDLTNDSELITETSATNKLFTHDTDVNAHNILFSEFKALAKKDKADYQTDIENLPVIPDAQIQSNWEQTDELQKDFIQNKPVIPVKVSDLDNDLSYQTNENVESKILIHDLNVNAHQDIRAQVADMGLNYYDKTEADGRYVQKEPGKGLSDQNFTADYKNLLNFFLTTTTVTSLANVSLSSQTIYANINSNQTLSVSGLPPAGQAVHIYVKNTASSNLTITIPTSGSYINMSAASVSILAGSNIEIDIVYDLNESKYKIVVLEKA